MGFIVASFPHSVQVSDFHSHPSTLLLESTQKRAQQMKNTVQDAPSNEISLGLLVGKFANAERLVGWKPRTSFKELVKVMIDEKLRFS